MQFQANDKQNQQTTKPTGHWVPTFGFEIKEGRKQTTNKDPATKYRTSCVKCESVFISGLLVVCLLAAWPETHRHGGGKPEKAIGYLHLHQNIHKHTYKQRANMQKSLFSAWLLDCQMYN